MEEGRMEEKAFALRNREVRQIADSSANILVINNMFGITCNRWHQDSPYLGKIDAI